MKKGALFCLKGFIREPKPTQKGNKGTTGHPRVIQQKKFKARPAQREVPMVQDDDSARLRSYGWTLNPKLAKPSPKP